MEVVEMLTYKCPCCNGALEFDPNLQKVKCPYCLTEFEMDDLKSLDEALAKEQAENLDWNTAAGGQWTDGETDGMAVYACQFCGGEIIGDKNMAATSCPYCGNPVVLTGKFSGTLRPDWIIPFKLDKAAAKAAMQQHFSGKKLLPKVFRDENHLEEIKGIYVPFWLFDADARADMRYRGTKVRHWSDSRYDYTETSHYSIFRAGTLAFDKIPADGSSKLADDLMESIEPYHYSEAVDFQTAYLAGYLADKYDVTADQNLDRVSARAKKSVEDTFSATVKGYATVLPDHSSVQINRSEVKYALLPVWILSTTWRGENYIFAMNGQTGKFVGNLPMDKGAYWRYWGISAGICAAAVALLGTLIQLL